MSLLRRALQAATRGSSARRGAAIADDVLSSMRAPAPPVPGGAYAASADEYDTIAYRGLRSPHNEGRIGGTLFFSDDPGVAETYVRGGDNPNMMRARLRLGRVLDVDAGGQPWNRISPDAIPDKAVRYALPGDRPRQTDEINRWARANGYDSVRFRNVIDEHESSAASRPSTVYAVFGAHNVRLPHARFRDFQSKDILAGLGVAAPLPLAAVLAQRDNRGRA